MMKPIRTIKLLVLVLTVIEVYARSLDVDDFAEILGEREVKAAAETKATKITIIDPTMENNSTSANTSTVPLEKMNSPTEPPVAVDTTVIHSPSTGTNFRMGEAFNFSHIYFLGGDCGNGDDGWYNDFTSAGMKSIAGAEIVCPPNPEEHLWWTREFHLSALDEVERLAGDKLNETLVITVGVNLETDWTPVADLMRKGMAFFHAKEDPLEIRNFNLTKHGLDHEEILYLYFQWDERSAAVRNGVELCRLMGGNSQLKVAKIYSGSRTVPLNYRVDIALESFKEECPGTEVILIWEKYNNVSDDNLVSTLLFNPIPDIIMVDSDHIAVTILESAEKALTKEEYNQITTVGWDNIYPELLRERKMLLSVDQMVHYPNQGIWRAIQSVVTRAQSSGLNSTAAIQVAMDRGDSMTMLADSLTVSGDKAGYLVSTLLAGYNPNFPPSESVQVTSGILGTTVIKMNPSEGKFEVVLWEKLAWRDPRLTWNPIIFDDELPIDPESIWTPRLYFQNEYENEDLYEAPAMLAFNGMVVLEKNIRATFLCSTNDGLKSFPFDSYNCSINLGAPPGVYLNQNFGFEIIESDPHYETSWSIDEGSDEKNHTALEDTHVHSHSASSSGEVHFFLMFTRKPITTYMRLILVSSICISDMSSLEIMSLNERRAKYFVLSLLWKPGIIINLIGFMAFWIPGPRESMALGITALIFSLAIRETVEVPDAASITWTGVFMMVNISYLASVMLITWLSYSRSTRAGQRLNNLCRPCRPEIIARKSRKRSESVAHQRVTTVDPAPLSSAVKRDKDNEIIRAELETVQEEMESRPISKPQHNGIMASTSLHSEASHNPELLLNSSPVQRISTSNESDDTNWDSYRTENEEEEFASSPQHDDEEFALPPQRQSAPAPAVALPPRPSIARRGSHFMSRQTKMIGRRNNDRIGTEDGAIPDIANVDWIGRWFIVPSYLVVIVTLIFGGWGFK